MTQGDDRGLCDAPDCGAFFDRPPILHWDSHQKKYVRLCHECAQLLEEKPWPRYERVDQLSPMKGANE